MQGWVLKEIIEQPQVTSRVGCWRSSWRTANSFWSWSQRANGLSSPRCQHHGDEDDNEYALSIQHGMIMMTKMMTIMVKARLMKCLDLEGYHDAILTTYSTLQSVDPLR